MLNSILLQAAGGGADYSGIIMIVVLIAIFYFFMIRPQQQRQKKIQKERDQLTKGSKVITSGGIYGKVKDVKGNIFIIEICDGVKISVDKNCIYAAADADAAVQDAEQQKQ